MNYPAGVTGNEPAIAGAHEWGEYRECLAPIVNEGEEEGTECDFEGKVELIGGKGLLTWWKCPKCEQEHEEDEDDGYDDFDWRED